MDSEAGHSGAERRDNWYVIRGIPVAVLVALAVQGGSIVWYLSGMMTRLEANEKALIADRAERATERAELKAEIAKLAARMDTIAQAVQNANVPAALNERRMSEFERMQARMEARIAENERKLATEAMRGRASRER